jgi:LPXTG-site transpeptidase (sortase) family protein
MRMSYFHLPWIRPSLLIVLLGAGLFGLANFQAYIQIARYDRAIYDMGVVPDISSELPQLAEPVSDVVEVDASTKLSEATVESVKSASTEGFSAQEKSQLSIPAIGLSAPMAWNIEEHAVQDNLNRGLVHYQGTAQPGQAGNMVVFGHSSDYFWKRNPYATVFALLPQLAIGDIIRVVDVRGVTHQYRVSETKVVSPYERSVMENVPGEKITLITCYPIGTTLNRYIVIGQLEVR